MTNAQWKFSPPAQRTERQKEPRVMHQYLIKREDCLKVQIIVRTSVLVHFFASMPISSTLSNTEENCGFVVACAKSTHTLFI